MWMLACLMPCASLGPFTGHPLHGLSGGGSAFSHSGLESWSALHKKSSDPFPMSKQDDGMGRTAKLVDLAMQVQLNGIDVAQAVKENNTRLTSATAETAHPAVAGTAQSSSRTAAAHQSPPPDGGGKGMGEVSRLQLEACQMVMDDCYDTAILPLVQALEERVYAGDLMQAEAAEFVPYSKFAQDVSAMLASCKAEIDKAGKTLQAQLEVVIMAASGGGRTVSSVDFETSQVELDQGPLRHLVRETRRELLATLERNLLRLWQQQKLVIREYELERFELSFQHLIAGSRSFNRTAAKLAHRANSRMRSHLVASLPRNINAWSCMPHSWKYDNDLEEFKHAVVASINVRRRQAGLDDLTSFWTEGDDSVVRPWTRRWYKRMAFRGLVLYAQVCQSSFAYRKAMGIPLPPFPSKPWLAAVLLPWRFQPGDAPSAAPVPASAAAGDGSRTPPTGDGPDAPAPASAGEAAGAWRGAAAPGAAEKAGAVTGAAPSPPQVPPSYMLGTGREAASQEGQTGPEGKGPEGLLPVKQLDSSPVPPPVAASPAPGGTFPGMWSSLLPGKAPPPRGVASAPDSEGREGRLLE